MTKFFIIRNLCSQYGMYIVAIAWLYVVLMMALVEALSTQGTVLGAVFTLLLYGLMPLGIALYILGTPARRQARQARDAAAETPAAASGAPDGGGHAPGDAVTAKREEV